MFNAGTIFPELLLDSNGCMYLEISDRQALESYLLRGDNGSWACIISSKDSMDKKLHI
jgi:hypothetical protein